MFKRHKGFTLIEIMIVAAIVAILASVAYPVYTNRVAKSRQVVAKAALEAARLAMENYRAKTGYYMPINNELTQLPGYDPGIWKTSDQRAIYELTITQPTTNRNSNYFLVTAVCDPDGTPPCNIDSDPAVDEWTIDSTGTMRNIQNDVD